VLQELDAAGIRPCRVAGTSMGAIIGSLYCSGMSGEDIEREVLDHLITDQDRLFDVLHKRKRLLRWIGALVPELRGRGLIRADGLLEMVMGEALELSFEDLELPLTVVATDYWTGEQVLFEEGPVRPAVRASMSVPGVFHPVELEGRVLVDGGVVNQVPYDVLRGSCDLVAAVDVGPAPLPGRTEVPGMLDAIAGAFDIVQNHLLEMKLEADGPDMLIRPRFEEVGLLDFSRAEEVLRLSRDAASGLRARLEERLAEGGRTTPQR
jgi:NTE family protein